MRFLREPVPQPCSLLFDVVMSVRDEGRGELQDPLLEQRALSTRIGRRSELRSVECFGAQFQTGLSGEQLKRLCDLLRNLTFTTHAVSKVARVPFPLPRGLDSLLHTRSRIRHGFMKPRSKDVFNAAW